MDGMKVFAIGFALTIAGINYATTPKPAAAVSVLPPAAPTAPAPENCLPGYRADMPCIPFSEIQKIINEQPTSKCLPAGPWKTFAGGGCEQDGVLNGLPVTPKIPANPAEANEEKI